MENIDDENRYPNSFAHFLYFNYTDGGGSLKQNLYDVHKKMWVWKYWRTRGWNVDKTGVLFGNWLADTYQEVLKYYLTVKPLHNKLWTEIGLIKMVDDFVRIDGRVGYNRVLQLALNIGLDVHGDYIADKGIMTLAVTESSYYQHYYEMFVNQLLTEP